MRTFSVTFSDPCEQGTSQLIDARSGAEAARAFTSRGVVEVTCFGVTTVYAVRGRRVSALSYRTAAIKS